jgi:hypothetical protein
MATGEPLKPPRTTGDPQTDLLILVKYLHDLYEAIQRTYLKQSQLGPDVQKSTQMLAAIANVVPFANTLTYFTTPTTATLTPLTAFARAILATTTAGDFVATLGLGLLSTKDKISTGDINDSQVTYTKIQDVSASSKLLGRTSTGAGTIEEISFTKTPVGGTISQLATRSTGVTLNGTCGVITTATTSLAAGSTATFTVSNSSVVATDIVIVSQQSGSNSGNTSVEIVATTSSAFDIRVSNRALVTAETGAININFAVLKSILS